MSEVALPQHSRRIVRINGTHLALGPPMKTNALPLLAVLLFLFVALLAVACGSGFPTCSGDTTCVDISGANTCATQCNPDAGATCPNGQACQSRGACCNGTDCLTAERWVCQ
jgi:hypothetical protein